MITTIFDRMAPAKGQSGVEQFIRKTTTPNRVDTFIKAYRSIKASGTKRLVETGCYRGTYSDGSSTLVLGAIARDVGGRLDAYELDPGNIAVSKNWLQQFGLLPHVNFYCGDSLAALATRTDPIGFVYLDSFDCGICNHRPSQEHQLAELEACLPLLEPKATVLLDDNMENKGGKTKLSIQRLHARGFRCLAHGYQVLFESQNTRALPRARFAVLCGHLKSFVPIAVDTIYRNKALYCLAHGYDLQIERFVRDQYADPKSHASGFSWSRMARMLELVQSGRYEWVWCVGGDTVITNMTVALEDIVAEAETTAATTSRLPDYDRAVKVGQPSPLINWTSRPGHKLSGKKHLICTGERVGPMQADSFLVRGSPEGEAYLSDILGQYGIYRHHPWVENQAMIDLRDKHAAITYILPQHRINAYQYNLYSWFNKTIYGSGTDCYGNRGQWQKGDFLVHWPGVDQQKRLALVKDYQPMIIPPNLNLKFVYCRVLGKGSNHAMPPDYYAAPTERFLRTYKQFEPDIPHELIVVNANPGQRDSLFNGVADHFIDYNADGWDVGTWQHVASCVDADLIVCFNSFAYFWRKGWLEPFIAAFREHGPGLYAPTASYQWWPHLRTPCMAFSPSILQGYPLHINSREMAIEGESGQNSFTQWALKENARTGTIIPVRMVTEAGSYAVEDWRKPANIFRRGNQANCLVWDRHTDIYQKASPEEKRQLEADADGPKKP